MSISIVIPTYNGARYLAPTIESVLAQSVTDWELVIVDDGSQDDSAAIAQSYADADERICVVRQANGGIARARNRGLAETRDSNPYVMFLDHDDLWEPDTIELLHTTLEADLKAVAAFGMERFVDDADQPVEKRNWSPTREGVVNGKLVVFPPGSPITYEVLAYENCIWSPGQVLYRRALVDRVGGFDPEAAPCDDWDLHIRLSLHGHFACTDRVVLLSRQHDNNTSRNTDLMLGTQSQVRRKLIKSSSIDSEHRRILLLAIRLLERKVASRRAQWARENLVRLRPLQAAKQARHELLAYARSLYPAGG